MDYLKQHGVSDSSHYQPPDRFWTFQLMEAAVFVGLAVALIAAEQTLRLRYIMDRYKTTPIETNGRRSYWS